MLGSAKGLLAIGAAAIGIGAGIWLAAKGVSAMADSFAKLNPKQLDSVLIAIGLLGASFIALGIAGIYAGPGMLMWNCFNRCWSLVSCERSGCPRNIFSRYK